MSAWEWITLSGVMMVLAAVPGGSVMLVTTRAASHGFAQGALVTLGIVLADLMFVAIAVAGLDWLTDRYAGLFRLVRYAGAAWLCWLGWQLLSSMFRAAPPPAQRADGLSSLAAGFVFTLGDIKALLFYFSFFPLFLSPGATDAADLSVLALVTVVSVGGIKLVYAWLGHRFRRQAGLSRIRPWASGVGGCLLLLVAVSLVVTA
jgi:threonine/homoserine/homoserine lactone efflux protein